MECLPHGKIFPMAYDPPPSVPPAQPFPVLAPHCAPAVSLLSVPMTVPSCPRVLTNAVRSSPSSFLVLWGPLPLLHPVFEDSRCRLLAENMSSPVTSKAAWVSGRKSGGSRGYLQVSPATWHFADFCPDLTLPGSRGTGLGRAEAAASCHCRFITHLLIAANGDFTAPPALVESCGSAVMEGKGGQPGNPSEKPACCPAGSLGPCKAEAGSYHHLVMRQGGLVVPTDSNRNPISAVS